MRVTVFVRGDDVHVVNMIGVKFAFSVIFLLRKLALFEVAEESLVGHDVVRIEGTLYCSHLVRHSILNDIKMENTAFIARNSCSAMCL